MMTTGSTTDLRRKEIMAINPRKIKKRPAKDLKPGDLRSQVLEKGKPTPAKDLRSTDPKSLRNKALREANRAANENKPRPAKDIKAGGSRAQFLKDAKAGTIKAKAPSGVAGVGRGLLKKIPVVGAAIGFIADASPAGTDSTVPGQAQKAVEKKMKREIRQGPKLAVTGVKEGSYKNYGEKIGPNRPKDKTFGPRISEGAKFERLRASRAALGSAKAPTSSSGNTSKVGGPGGARAYENVKDKKSSSASTAATSAAASSGRKRPSTRYQRNELAMEQRNRSSSGQRKSILSLFRKG